jgi:hypothetical protein
VRVTEATRHLHAIPSSASPEQAAAIVAALERFMRATAPPPSASTRSGLDGWQRTALLEGVSRAPAADADGADVPWMFPTPG